MTPQREASERSRAFKDGQRFRAGIEGRISVLMRGRGVKRCLAQGAERFELFVGAAVLANNLMKIGELLVKRAKRRSNKPTDNWIRRSGPRRSNIVDHKRAQRRNQCRAPRVHDKKHAENTANPVSGPLNFCPIHRHNCYAIREIC